MVFSAKFTSFAVALTLVLLITDSFALTHQVLKDFDGKIGLDAAGKNLADISKDHHDHGVLTVAAEERNIRHEGRKMMSRSSTLKKKAVNMGNLDAKEAKISGAALSVGNCNDKEEGNVNVIRCKPAVRNRSSPHHRVKVKMAGYTAFSADYHFPKSHPPKNN